MEKIREKVQGKRKQTIFEEKSIQNFAIVWDGAEKK